MKRTHQSQNEQYKRPRLEPEQTPLTLPPARYPFGTPMNSKRSRKYYSDFVDDREFLKHLKGILVKKLETLKEDHKFLKDMKKVKREQVEGLQPLFSREEDLELEQENTPTITLPVVNNQPKLITSLEELDQLDQVTLPLDSPPHYSSIPDNYEDEEESRRKLHLALQAFNL